jgi:hypothetical protein
MTAGLAITIALVVLSILALEKPFAGITRIEPDAFDQLADIFVWSQRQSQSAPVAARRPISMGSLLILSKGVALVDIA